MGLGHVGTGFAMQKSRDRQTNGFWELLIPAHIRSPRGANETGARHERPVVRTGLPPQRVVVAWMR